MKKKLFKILFSNEFIRLQELEAINLANEQAEMIHFARKNKIRLWGYLVDHEFPVSFTVKIKEDSFEVKNLAQLKMVYDYWKDKDTLFLNLKK